MLFFKIAARFLKHSKGQTILITLGIAIGVSVQLFIGLLIQGLQSSLIDKTIGSASHVTVTSEIDNKTIGGYSEIIDKARTVEGVIYVSAALDRAAFVTVSDNNESVLIRGLSLEQADGIYKFSKSLTGGDMPLNTNEVIIGKQLAENANYKVGDILKVNLPNIGEKEVKISGIFDLGVANVNKTWVVTSLNSAQTLYGTGDIVSSIEIQINDVFDSENVAKTVNGFLKTGYKAADWQTQNEELLSGLNGQSISSIMIQVFVVVSVVLGIASVLAISVLQKSRQLGILKAMGIKNGTASLIYMTQGLILGLMGAIIGIALGLALSYAFSAFALNPDGTPLIPLTINASFVALSGIIAVVASMGAALIPAIKSTKLDPIEVIRNG